jgi:hypothetical protein
MASLLFNTEKVDESKAFTPVPAGRYLVEVISSEIKQTKTGKGEYIFLILRIVEGPHEGKKIFDRINFINQNKDAENIAQRALKKLCLACGVRGELKDTEQLHFKRFHAHILVRQDPGYPAQNSIRYPDSPADAPLFENGSGAVATKEKPAPIARPKPSGAAKPWQKEPRF